MEELDEDIALLLAQKIAEVKRQVEKLLQQPQKTPKDGKDGKDGLPGKPGRDGQPGKDGKVGKDGKDGKDGISIVDASIAADGHLVLKLSNGSELDCGDVMLGSEGSHHTSIQKRIGGPQVYVQLTAPVNPSQGDIWFDIS